MANSANQFERARDSLLEIISAEVNKSGITPTDRPEWNEYFMGLAEFIALRSTCYNRKVGVVVVRDTRIIATGYNGAASGITSCFDMGYCLRKNLMQEHSEDAELIGDLFTQEKAKSIIEELSKHRTQRYCRAQHAEENAITQAARLGIPLEGTDTCMLPLSLVIDALN